MKTTKPLQPAAREELEKRILRACECVGVTPDGRRLSLWQRFRCKLRRK